MHTFYLFALLGFLLEPSLSQTTFYVNETNKTKNPDGSKDHPFPSLEDAFLKISPGTFDIILLGHSITITSQVTFPEGSICIIRPQTIPENGYYPLNFRMKGSITIRQANVTFQDIQFDYAALDPDTGTLIDMYGGLLLLNKTLVSDIQDQDPYITFIRGGGDIVNKAALFLVDSHFKNLRNFGITAGGAKVTIQNTSFENLEIDAAFLTILTYPHEEAALRMSNISVVNSKFLLSEYMYSAGLVSIEESSVNISIEGFSVKNVSLQNGAALIGIIPYMNTPIYPTKVNIWDVIFEDIVEIEDEELKEPEKGVEIFRLEGPFELTVRNLTARNIQFKSGFLLKYRPDYSTLPFAYNPYSQISLQNIKIENCSQTNFLVQNPDSGQVENVELLNVTFKKSPVFSFKEVGIVSIKNIYGRNISGSLISLDGVFSQDLENLTFGNVSTSPKYFIRFSGDVENRDFAENADRSIVITNFFIDGFEYIGAKEDAYLLRIDSEIGTVLIRDSIWRNINTGGLLSHNMNALKVDNLSVSGVSAQAAEIFRFESSNFVKIANSRFHNNENRGVVVLNVPEDVEYQTKGLVVFFENTSVVENNSTNVFEFKSPNRTLRADFLNCLFQDNKISGSMIKITKSQRVNISLDNNAFMRNYAQGAGGILTTENMQENMSILLANNNVFQDNTCWANGGIFYFMDVWYQVFFTNNTYKNNTSAENGSIGYIDQSTVSFLEQSSFYSDNTAEKDGGLWFIRSSNQLQKYQPPIFFTNTFFNNSFSGNNGGAFYISNGNLSINSSLFTKSQAEESGGVFYLETFSSLLISDSIFQEMNAPEGSLVFASSLMNAFIVIQGVNINDARASDGEGILVSVNSSFVRVNNSGISGISGQLLFDLKGSSVKFDGVRISDIDCSEVKETCVLNGQSVELEWEDTEIWDVVLQGDLMVLDEKSVEKGEVKTVNITKVE